MMPSVAAGLPLTPTAIAALIALVVLAAIVLYGRLASLATRSEHAWVGIDGALRRRHELALQLAETVKGLAETVNGPLDDMGTVDAVERAILTARDARGPLSSAAAESGLTAALRGLFARAERCVGLDGSDRFLHLQRQLSAVEDAIVDTATTFNDTVRGLNATVVTFPWNVLAGWGGFRPRDRFDLSAEATRSLPRITLE